MRLAVILWSALYTQHRIAMYKENTMLLMNRQKYYRLAST